MLHSITFIKTIYSLLFIFMVILMGITFFTLLLDKISYITWIGIGFIFVEGLVLLANGKRCPLTVYTEDLGAEDGSITRILLPAIIASQIVKIFGIISVICFMMFLIRLII